MRVTDEERATRRARMKAGAERARAHSAETDRIVGEKIAGRARWMCEPCRAEGHGLHPETCPECGASGGWLESYSGDPRPMGEIFGEMVAFLESTRRKDEMP